MNILWQNAWLAPALALIAVPVLVHLFARARPRRYVFSSTRFLARAVRQTMRVKRPQDWLLLVLRTLLFLAVLLMFLKPVAFSTLLAPTGAQRQVVVLVDASASMAYVEGGRTRFAAACAQASEILSGLSAGDRADVIFVDASPEAELPELSPNLAYLRERLRQAAVTQESGNAAQALQAAAELLGPAGGERELWIVSDFQRTNWKDAAAPLPEGVAVRYLPIGEEDAANVALTGVRAEPAAPVRGEEVAYVADLANYSAMPRQVTVYLEAGETRESQQVSLPAWGTGSAFFQAGAGGPGTRLVRFAIDNDAFAPDDERRLLVTVGDGLKAKIAGPTAVDNATADVWRRAVSALPMVGAVTNEVALTDMTGSGTWRDLGLAAFAGTNLGPYVTTTALETLRAGGQVWLQPMDGASFQEIGNLSGTELPEIAVKRETRDEPWHLRLTAPEDPAFRLFANGDAGDPTRASFHARYRVDPQAPPKDWETLLAFDDGAPALVRVPLRPVGGEASPGHLLLWFMDLDPQTTNWPKQPEFLVLVGELLETGRATSPPGGYGVEPGQALAFQAPENTVAGEVTLHAADGTALDVARGDPSTQAYRSDALAVPGVYTWRVAGDAVGYGLVNFPPVESDLRAFRAQDLERDGAVTLDEGANLRDLSEGHPLWPALLAAAVLLVLLETLALLWTRQA